MRPQTRYAKSGDVNIAYEVVGDGPRDLVVVPGWLSNVDLFWAELGDRKWRERKLGGLAVHIGARVASLAKAGEALVSSTVKDLVAGSGLAFQERGVYTLKGVPGEWRVFAVDATQN